MAHSKGAFMTRRFLLALLALAGACAPDGPTADSHFAVDTVAGVEHRRNSGDPVLLSVDRIARIGAVEEGPAAFGRIRSVIADENGHVYVADNIAGEVRVFDESGTHLSSFGRRGGGPGEFEDLYSLAWLGSRIAVMDPGNARIGLFTRDGTWVSGIRHYPLTGPGTLIRLHPAGKAGFYAPVIDSRRPDLPFVRIASEGAADTIGAPGPPADAPRFWVRCERPDGGIQGISVPDAPTTVFGFPPSGDRVAVAWTAAYRIALLDSAGDTVRIVERIAASLSYPDSVWSEAMRPLREVHEEYPGTRCDPPNPDRPAPRSALRSIAFTDVGTMCVEAATASGFAWDIFDQEGRLVGSAPAPARDTSVPVYVSRDRLYQVETDDLGVQYVAVYRFRPGSAQ
jgi:hypothetical protein